MKKIEITIHPDGTSETDLTGFHGQGCHEVLSDFGGDDRATLTRLKPEYREVVKQKERQKA
jgi:hypothetical protein